MESTSFSTSSIPLKVPVCKFLLQAFLFDWYVNNCTEKHLPTLSGEIDRRRMNSCFWWTTCVLFLQSFFIFASIFIFYVLALTRSFRKPFSEYLENTHYVRLIHSARHSFSKKNIFVSAFFPIAWKKQFSDCKAGQICSRERNFRFVFVE